jgi:hypothetical protein
MKPKIVKMQMCALAALALGAASSAFAAEQEAAYEVTFTALWTADKFPVEYPAKGLISFPHFSGVIGASHGARYTLFKEGMQPGRGLERLSEEGKHAPLDEEIKAAIARGDAGMLFETDPVKDPAAAPSVKGMVKVTAANPTVSAVAMIAPSPDWFAGVAGVSLLDGGKFVAEKTVDLFAYDSGGDNGATYTASDADASPKQATSMASPKHFMVNGKAMPVARITFKRK